MSWRRGGAAGSRLYGDTSKGLGGVCAVASIMASLMLGSFLNSDAAALYSGLSDLQWPHLVEDIGRESGVGEN